MVIEKMDRALPCLSRRAIVDIGYAAYFPSNDGLAVISATDAQIVSRNLFTREQWKAMSPDTFIASTFDGRYLFTYTASVFDTIDGSDPSGTGLPADYLDGGAPTGGAVSYSYDFGTASSAFGTQRLGSIDVAGELPFFIDFDVALPAAMHSDRATGTLYFLEGTTAIKEWDAPESIAATQTWLSKPITLQFPTNFGAILIETDNPIGPGDTFQCQIIADRQVTDTVTSANQPVRLSSGFMANVWELEVLSTVTITGITLAHTMEELVA